MRPFINLQSLVKMKKLRYILIALPALLLLPLALTSCEMETSDNGKLDGFWHLERVDTLATGGTCDLSEQLLFWSVQAKLLGVSDRNYRLQSAFFRFEHANGTLRLYEPREDERMEGDPDITDTSLLAPFGINSLDETFSVERLTGSEMVLKTNALRLVFKRF
jgi:hypothetical protein